MFSSISWHDFALTLIIILGLYYAAVLSKFYGSDIFKILKRGLLQYTKRVPQDVNTLQAPPPLVGVGQLTEELHFVFEKAARQPYHREELLQALQGCLKKYQHLKDTAIQSSITLYIQQTAAACKIYLDQGDLRQLWGL